MAIYHITTASLTNTTLGLSIIGRDFVDICREDYNELVLLIWAKLVDIKEAFVSCQYYGKSLIAFVELKR